MKSFIPDVEVLQEKSVLAASEAEAQAGREEQASQSCSETH